MSISNEYLPRNKYDFERVNQLKKMDRTELLPLLPGLMEWIQDMNWPIAVFCKQKVQKIAAENT